MATLIVLQGPKPWQQFPLAQGSAVIGRTAEASICLPAQSVSRRHAQISFHDGAYVLEDLGSVNGTFVNGQRLTEGQALTDGDQLKIGHCVLAFRVHAEETVSAAAAVTDTAANIIEKVDAAVSNEVLYLDQPGKKLRIVLELARHLGQALEPQVLLEKLLELLLDLFPLADRGLIVLCDSDRLVVRAQRSRRQGDADIRFSRSVIQQTLKDGVGLLSADLQVDERFSASSSLGEVGTKSVLCVPLIVQQGKPLGVIQLDCTRPGKAFGGDHLRLLTTLSLLAAVVLENVALQDVRVREEKLRRDLGLAREIQLGFLPIDWAPPPDSGFEICARLHPARDVSGDLYDFFPLPDGRLAFLVGDVSDKGVPAAMFMVKVQTLVRHLAVLTSSPGETLRKLNDALAVNNPSSMFVTMALGIYEPASGAVVLASGGHPRPLLRRTDGSVDEASMRVGRLIGCFEGDPGAVDERLTLARGETLILYSDGYIEAAALGSGGALMGLRALKELLGGAHTPLPLTACADNARLAMERFTGSKEPQDDLTLLLLRRV
jgi:serine phosphatase RsbU (regulator of sigma subunit)